MLRKRGHGLLVLNGHDPVGCARKLMQSIAQQLAWDCESMLAMLHQ